MAPRLKTSQRQLVASLLSNNTSVTEIATIVNCNPRSVYGIKRRLRTKHTLAPTPDEKPGPARTLSPRIMGALLVHLNDYPNMIVRDMCGWILDEFDIEVSISTVHRSLKTVGWDKQVAMQLAEERRLAGY